MTSRELIFAGVGAVIGAAATYVIMDRMFEKELDEIYGEIDEKLEVAEQGFDTIINICSDVEPAEELDIAEIIGEEGVKAARAEIERGTRKERAVDGAVRVLVDAPEEEEFSEFISSDLEEDEEEDEDPEEDESEVSVRTEYNGIFIIPNDQVSDRQVVGEYNHDNGSVTVVKMMSVESESFDDVIENDALYSLINEEAFDILMNAEPSDEKRIIAIRNNVINLDFAIAY